jgi:hypothetical protein
MILYKSTLAEEMGLTVDDRIKSAIKVLVCMECRYDKDCKDESGNPCDLVDPIVLTVEYESKGEVSCTGCTFDVDDYMGGICNECARMHDNSALTDFYEEKW